MVAVNAAWLPRASVQTGQDSTTARGMISALECNHTPQHSCPSPALSLLQGPDWMSPSPGGLPVHPALPK